jgi:hypothetical protein
MATVGACQLTDGDEILFNAAQTRTSLQVGPLMSLPTDVNAPDIPDSSFSWDTIPADVLLEITSYLRDDRYVLRNLTRVCNYWRQVLVDCPLNWTQISTKYPPKLFRLWLQRSKSAPVDAEICHLSPELYGGFISPWVDRVD